MRNEKLGWFGVLTTMAGALIMPSYNFEGTDVTVLGSDYCVREGRSVRDGGRRRDDGHRLQ